MRDNLWYELRHGSRDEALQGMTNAYREKPDAASILQLGSALLFVEDYDGAWRHYQEAIQNYRWSVDSFHLGAGAAKWCLGHADEAVQEWSRGLKCKYSDAARLWVPLVLYVASVLTPRAYPDTEARKLLVKRSDNPMARHWPGSIARFLLGRIDEHALLANCEMGDRKAVVMQRWEARFYIGVHECARNNPQRFHQAMHCASIVADDDFNPQSLHYRWKFGRDEFFIARYEEREQRVK